MKHHILYSAALLLTTAACVEPGDPALASKAAASTCSTTTTNLLAGQSIHIGSVTVTQDDVNLCVRYDITDLEWYITETHMHLADDPDALPQTGSGNPQVGHFDYSNTGLHAQYNEFCVDYVAAGYAANSTLYIAAHAVVQREVGGSVVQSETAWGEGDGFSGKSWAMYFDATLEPCQPDPICGWRTQTQAEWGDTSDPAGSYMWSYYNSTFPFPGIDLGCGSTYVSFQNRHPVDLHLPVSGAPRPLTTAETSRRYLDGWATTDAEGNTVPLYDPQFGTRLWGETAALAINVGFDANRTDFTIAPTPHPLSALVVVSPDSPCAGLTVAEVLTEAQNVLFGCASVFTPDQISACVTSINTAFQDGADSAGGAVCTTYLATP